MDTEETNKKIKDLETRLKKLEDILYGISDDIRVKEVIRKNVIVGEHTAGKPIIINRAGKRYNLQIV
jgi:hypothetical protein